MPPVRFKPPQQVRIKCPKGRIAPLDEPEIKLGKTIVAAAPHRITAEQLEQARRTLRRCVDARKVCPLISLPFHSCCVFHVPLHLIAGIVPGFASNTLARKDCTKRKGGSRNGGFVPLLLRMVQVLGALEGNAGKRARYVSRHEEGRGSQNGAGEGSDRPLCCQSSSW